MHRDHFPTSHTAMLCEQSAALRDELFDVRALSAEVKIQARAAQHRSQRTREESQLLVRALRARMA